jgi:hypothetical protein
MPLAKDAQTISATGGWAGGVEIFSGWSTGSGTLAYHRGLFNSVEGGVSASYLRVSNNGYNLNIEPQAFSLRLSAKASTPAVSKFASARFGVGLGTSDAGQYVGTDLGLVFGWDNPYVVPFLSGGAYASFPFNTKVVMFFNENSGNNTNGTTVDADNLETTYGVEAGAGLKVYLLNKNRRNPNKVSLGLFGVGKITVLRAEYHSDVETPISGGGGIELEF